MFFLEEIIKKIPKNESFIYDKNKLSSNIKELEYAQTITTNSNLSKIDIFLKLNLIQLTNLKFISLEKLDE